MLDKPTPRFEVQAGALRAAAAAAGCFTGNARTIPILPHLLLSAEGGQLAMSGTNMQAYIVTTTKGDGDLHPITVSAARLSAVLALLPAEETVALHLWPTGQLGIEAGAMKAKLFTLPPEDFPTSPALIPKARWSITAGALGRLFGQCLHAVSREETRYYLNGVHLAQHNTEDETVLRAAATDGHRLMVAQVPMPEGDAPIPMIFPHDALRKLIALLRRMPTDHLLNVEQTDLEVQIITPGWTLRVKTIDGTFPDVDRVIPKDGEGTPVQVHDARGMAEAVRTVTAVSAELSKPVKFSNGIGNTLRLFSIGPNNCDCEISVPAEVASWATNSAHPEVGYQARYLLDLCAVFPGGFTMRVADAAPCRIEAPQGLAVLMPMRV